MAILETVLKLRVVQIPTGRPVPGVRTVRLRVTKRMLCLCVEMFRIKAGLALDKAYMQQTEGNMLVCEHRPLWLDEEEQAVDVPWFLKGVEPLFVSKHGTIHLMNMHRKMLMRSEYYSLTTLMEDFGEDPRPVMRDDGQLPPGQQQGRLVLLPRL